MRFWIVPVLIAVACAGCRKQPDDTATAPAAPAEAPAATPAAVNPPPPPAASPAPPAPVARTATGAIIVTPANFIRAESDTYIANLAKESGGLGKLLHRREPASIDNQTVIRLNRDTLYSSAVYDLDAGPVTVTLPDAGDRFQSLMFITQDHDSWTEYGAGKHEVSRDKAGTRYVVVGVRTLADPNDPADMEIVHRLQDAIVVEQAGGPGTLDLPTYDAESQKKVRDALLALGATTPTFDRAFGPKGEVDPVNHLIGTAAGWGGNADKDAKYVSVTPPKNDGKTVYRLRVKDVPVEAFWSVTVYDAKGYFQKNAQNAYSLNNLTAKKDDDGGFTIQFGGCDGKVPNCLPTVPGWNYTVRMYRPQQAVLDGSWTFPAAEVVS